MQHTRFLAQVSPQAADKLRMDIIEAAKSLQEFPERGSWLVDSALPANVYGKLLVDKRYLLIYKIKDDTVYNKIKAITASSSMLDELDEDILLRW